MVPKVLAWAAGLLTHRPPHVGLFCFGNMPNSSLYLGLYANLPGMFFLLILACPTSCHCKCQFKCHLFGETFSDVPSERSHLGIHIILL